MEVGLRKEAPMSKHSYLALEVVIQFILLSFIHDMIYQYYLYYVWKEIQVFLGYDPCGPLDLPLTWSTSELLLLIIETYNYIFI